MTPIVLTLHPPLSFLFSVTTDPVANGDIVARHREIWLESVKDPVGFWSRIAEELHWFRKWEVTLDDSRPPFYRWFVGGELNISHNALDRHLPSKANKAALIWVSSDGSTRVLTYRALWQYVNRLSLALRRLGFKRGDRATIYMPMVPEAMVAMLSIARLGGIHSVVFSGFGPQALADRIASSGSRFIITTDAMRRRGKVIRLKDIVDEALGRVNHVEHVIVHRHLGVNINITTRDHLWNELINETPPNAFIEPERVKAEEPLFILYTSGTTGKPKGVTHLHGSYTVWAYAHNKWLFGFRDWDIFFTTPDIGWINGHSYSTYGPLLNGATVLWYEDAPDYPSPDTWWRIIDEHGVTLMWVAPTGVRLLMKYGDEYPRKYSLSTLRLVVSAGEILGNEAWTWLHNNICRDRIDCHIIETWGQTENSGFITAPGGFGLAGGIAYRQGSVGLPYPGIVVSIIDEEGRELPPRNKGLITIKPPVPPAFMHSNWGDPEGYIKTYWSRFPGLYLTGDYGYMDEDGYVYVLGRVDDTLKVGGHRIGPAEIENIVTKHSAVAEAAVVGIPDPVRGTTIAIFVTPKTGKNIDPTKLAEEIKEIVRREYGPIATVSQVYVVDKLPRTRTGKIMRRILRATLTGEPAGDTSTLEEESSIEELRKTIEEKHEK